MGKSEYYCLILLESLKENRAISLVQIAQKYRISLDFLYKIASKLKKAGFLESKEGVKGGYILTQKAKQISLFDILQVLNKDQQVQICTCHNSSCSRITACQSYSSMHASLEEKLKEITLTDIV